MFHVHEYIGVARLCGWRSSEAVYVITLSNEMQCSFHPVFAVIRAQYYSMVRVQTGFIYIFIVAC